MRMAIDSLHVDVPTVDLAYDVICGGGALNALPALLAARGLTGRALVCTDDNVAPLHGARAVELLRGAGVDADLWTMPAGERYKTLETVNSLYEWLAARRAERRDLLVACGGGVVGDLSGFAAATYLRGLRLIQVPTTLVAQVDSTVGGKVGVDLPAGKNLVGAFHQPSLVVADPLLLSTLPAREWSAGLAEVVKHGVIGGGDLLDDLEREHDVIMAREPTVVAPLVARAVAVKIDVVRQDPLEAGLRRVLNYGHTLGHAIERVAGYGVVLHGEAVAWGMAAAARIGAEIGTCDAAFVEWQDNLLRGYGLLRPLPALDADALIAATRLDKKVVAGRVKWVLPRRAGDVIITDDVPDEVARRAAAWLARKD
jgi:3-dehydroquinate synthase